MVCVGLEWERARGGGADRLEVLSFLDGRLALVFSSRLRLSLLGGTVVDMLSGREVEEGKRARKTGRHPSTLTRSDRVCLAVWNANEVQDAIAKVSVSIRQLPGRACLYESPSTQQPRCNSSHPHPRPRIQHSPSSSSDIAVPTSPSAPILQLLTPSEAHLSFGPLTIPDCVTPGATAVILTSPGGMVASTAGVEEEVWVALLVALVTRVVPLTTVVTGVVPFVEAVALGARVVVGAPEVVTAVLVVVAWEVTERRRESWGDRGSQRGALEDADWDLRG